MILIEFFAVIAIGLIVGFIYSIKLIAKEKMDQSRLSRETGHRVEVASYKALKAWIATTLVWVALIGILGFIEIKERPIMKIQTIDIGGKNELINVIQGFTGYSDGTLIIWGYDIGQNSGDSWYDHILYGSVGYYKVDKNIWKPIAFAWCAIPVISFIFGYMKSNRVKDQNQLRSVANSSAAVTQGTLGNQGVGASASSTLATQRVTHSTNSGTPQATAEKPKASGGITEIEKEARLKEAELKKLKAEAEIAKIMKQAEAEGLKL
jgi:hypothetical protein